MVYCPRISQIPVHTVSFTSDINKFVAKTKGRNAAMVEAVALEMSKRLIMRTPVGDPSLWKRPPPPGYKGGQAKANWFSTVGSPSSTVAIGLIDPSGAVSIARAIAASKQAAGNIFYIVNGLPYMRKLEYGHSTQAPNGMVRLTVAEFRLAVKLALGSIRSI